MTSNLTSLVVSATVPRTEPDGTASIEALFDQVGFSPFPSAPPPSVIFLKPDFGGPHLTESGGATDPALIASIARLFVRAGARVEVGDSPFADGRPVAGRWDELGLPALADAVGFHLVDLEASGTRIAAVKDTAYYPARPAIRADLVVNLPRFRPHDRFVVSGALTNMLGLLPGFQKTRHMVRAAGDRAAGRLLVDLYALVQPALTVLDLGESDTGRGNQVCISTDGIAVDVLLANRLGLSRARRTHIAQAAEAGLGIGWPEGIRAAGDDLGGLPIDIPVQWKHHPSWFRQRLTGLAASWIWSRPTTIGSACGACSECIKICPTKALRRTVAGEAPSIEPHLCIGCWQCSAVCPSRTITPEQSRLARLLSSS